jgi:uncharacterized repeat protein (TIGR03803 family)
MRASNWLAIVFVLLAGEFVGAAGQTVAVLYSFGGADGTYPTAVLAQGSDGNFYGTTFAGGASTNCSGYLPVFNLWTVGCGTVFQITPSGTLTTLYSFSGNDGVNPMGALVEGIDGNFYGTTYQGGSNGMGTVFRISSSGTFSSIHSFSGIDGEYPYAGLVLGGDGNFYGTTYQGGNGGGNVFRISPGGICTNLHSFNGSDGVDPRGGLAQGSDGNFYSTTFLGGTGTNCPGSCGTVFRISPSGSFTNLHSFSAGYGDRPIAGLVQGSDGNFYGATPGGQCPGANCSADYGTVFKISPQGDFTELLPVGSVTNFLYVPESGLIQGSDGLLYGTVIEGKIYRLNPATDEADFYPMSSNANYYPYAGLVQGVDGSFYGTSMLGGSTSNCSSRCGIVYKFSVPLNPALWPINQITNVQVSATNVLFGVVSISGESYQLQFSSSMNPANWVNVSGVSVTNSIGALLTLTNFGGATGSQGFYRFAITP